MPVKFQVIDLFAGPGGLAEGFSGYKPDGKSVFDIALSVEMEDAAFETLRLRAFYRQFVSRVPDEYYELVRGERDLESLKSLFPVEWQAACKETLQLKMGDPEATAILDPLLDKIAAAGSQNLILVGGPPCQAYSLVGRARNKGKAGYQPGEDHRYFLYQEYVRILTKLQPAAFVMENVKGMLSAKLNGERIFPGVLSALEQAGQEHGGYRIMRLTDARPADGREHLLKSEVFRVPQRRHRIIIFGVRADIADQIGLSAGTSLDLMATETPVSVADIISDMPKLRSGLSREPDTFAAWKSAATTAFRDAAKAANGKKELKEVEQKLKLHANVISASDVLSRWGTGAAKVSNNELSEWLVDARLDALPNHETRGHMRGDLARYAFAVTYAEVFGRSPKAKDFPPALAPEHQNWESGKFTDRFRVQIWKEPATTITSHISKDGHYFIHPDPLQCRSLTVREAARLQTFPDNYLFRGGRTQQFVQVGNAVPPFLAWQIAEIVFTTLSKSRQRDKPEPDRMDVVREIAI